MGVSRQRPGVPCQCGIRERVALLKRGPDILDVVDLRSRRIREKEFTVDRGRRVDPRLWAVNHLVERGWVPIEISHLVLEHGRWLSLGDEWSTARVKSFVRDVAIQAVPPLSNVNVMRPRSPTLLNTLARTKSKRS